LATADNVPEIAREEAAFTILKNEKLVVELALN
jgi:hypothetical protein